MTDPAVDKCYVSEVERFCSLGFGLLGIVASKHRVMDEILDEWLRIVRVGVVLWRILKLVGAEADDPQKKWLAMSVVFDPASGRSKDRRRQIVLLPLLAVQHVQQIL